MVQLVDFVVGVPQVRGIDVRWMSGSPSAKHNTDPDIQVYAYDAHTYILRQNKAVHYEAPFLYLLFGNERAMLLDTGATEAERYFPLRGTVDGLIEQWLAEHPRPGYQLLVLHTHSHGDHVAGDGQFAGRPDTTVVPADRSGAWAYFGFDADPQRAGRVDLGGRVLECLATPGHDAAAVTYYDPYTGFLLTGDTVYPGRLYVEDLAAYRVSIERMIAFADSHPVTHVMGCHIEMSTEPGVDYPVRTTYQPDEPPLQMTVEQLRQVGAAFGSIDATAGRHPYQSFIICI
ncbi:MBL fold metallo-hydrolase [Dactylosporangium sp. NBC_01737]|uniref:MBL fold metallo-hydrolase n=1 Tax=Dactylosporangium sp. NBC_01737 TaxID=2975959 RepID=UPI002E15ECD2|nr:MBL fold metallo-hydrolase [Dactylosporangium sp. NBC_01737]